MTTVYIGASADLARGFVTTPLERVIAAAYLSFTVETLNQNEITDYLVRVVQPRLSAIVRIADIAEVVLGAEDYDTEVRFSGKAAVLKGIWPLPNANSLDVI